MSIDLKYLGVQLPLSYSNYSLWSYPGTNPNSPGEQNMNLLRLKVLCCIVNDQRDLGLDAVQR